MHAKRWKEDILDGFDGFVSGLVFGVFPSVLESLALTTGQDPEVSTPGPAASTEENCAHS